MFVYIAPHSLNSYSIKSPHIHFAILSRSRHRPPWPPCFNYNVLWYETKLFLYSSEQCGWTYHNQKL